MARSLALQRSTAEEGVLHELSTTNYVCTGLLQSAYAQNSSSGLPRSGPTPAPDGVLFQPSQRTARTVPGPAPAAAIASNDVAGLLAFSASIPNYAAIANIPAGEWTDDGSPPCDGSTSHWKYVICEDNAVIALNISDVPLNGALRMHVHCFCFCDYAIPQKKGWTIS